MARILIVEDDEVTSAILARSILRAGHQVDVAKNGLAAIEMLEDGDYGLLITDLMMPRLGGQELCEIIRSDERYPDIPILITTGVIDAERLSWVTMFPGVEVIAKPIEVIPLIERIAELTAS